MKFIIIGRPGSDAGYWEYENGHWVHHGGWGIDALADVSRSLEIIGEAALLKTPGLADSVTKTVSDLVEKELNTHLGNQVKQGVVVIINAG